ncbi:APC family permease [Streptomyces massasporeus]|uniref:APC family permease n=1 Tax=Streptomyces massasporeus TaxID=67324 RepID=UPI00341061BD
MLTHTQRNTDGGTPPGRSARHAQLRILPLVGLIFFSVSGGPFGLENAVGGAGAGMTLAMLLLVPLVYGIPCALMVAELGTALPLKGGFYSWVKVGLGPRAAFAKGMWVWMAACLSTSLFPIIFADYLAQWVPALARGNNALLTLFGGAISIDGHWVAALCFMVPLAWLNSRGAHVVGRATLVMMVFVLAPFVVMAVLAAFRVIRHPQAGEVAGFTVNGAGALGSAGVALGVILWCYSGWDAPSPVLNQVADPGRTLRRALLWSVPLIILSYVVPVVAALASGLHAGRPELWGGGDFAAAAALLGGSWLKSLVTIGAVVSTVGLFSSLLIPASQTPSLMARDGYLPQSLARTSPRFGTPVRSIVVCCLIFAVFCSMEFTVVIDAAVLISLGGLMLEFASLVVLRRRHPDLPRPFRVPGGTAGLVLVVAGPAAVTVWMIWSTWHYKPLSFWIGVVYLAAGGVLYPLAKRLGTREPEPADLGSADLGPAADRVKADLARR